MMNLERPTRWHRCLFGTLALASLLVRSQAQIQLDICLPALQKADANENSRLSGLEYVAFLNDATSGEYGFTSYDDLPEALLMNFEIFDEGGGVIDIRGATLGENATRREKRVVETLCETTDMALDAIAYTAAPSDFESTVLPESDQSEMKAQAEDAPSPNTTLAEQTNTSLTSTLVNETMQVNRTTTLPPGTTASNTTSESNTTTFTSLDDEAQATTEPTPNGTTNNSEESTETAAPSAEASNITDPNITSSPANSTPTEATDIPTPFVVENTTNATAELNTTSTDLSPTVAPTVVAVATPVSVPTMAPNASAFLTFNSTNATEAPEDLLPASPTQSPSAAPSRDAISECKRVMRFSDIDADGNMSKVEYVWFLNDNWDNPYPGVAFRDLPVGLKDNFYSFASVGEINIAMLNAEDPMSDDQEEFLERLCTETEAALSLESNEESNGQEASMSTFEKCLESVTLFDANADTWLDYAEYVSLISELSQRIFGLGTFGDLPDVLKENFYSLAISATIDLGGAKHGTTLSNSQQEIVENICVDTSYALEKVSDGENLDGTDTNTMLEYAACFMGMNDHDINNDTELNEAEYIGLVNLMGKNRFQDAADFEDLPLVLQDNFLNLQNNGTINITGSQDGQVPDNSQQHFLGRVCIETTAAVNMAIAMGIPETSPPILPEGEPLTIHSSFNIYSDVWISDEEFESGATRMALEEAYRQFVMKVVDGLKDENGQGQSLGRQAAPEGPLTLIDRDSPSIESIVDLSCAGASEGASCKTIFATYEIIPMEGDMDREALYDEYVRVTQSHIDGGMLQAALERVDPATAITVIGASEPVVYDSQASTQMPISSIPVVTDDDGYEERMENNKKKTIALVAVGVGCLLVASLIGLIMVRYRKQKADKMSGSSSQANSADHSVGKASDTHDEFHQEGISQGSQRGSQRGSISHSTGSGHSSRIFRTRMGDKTDYDDDVINDVDEELGKMQIVDLDLNNCEGITAASNDFEAITQKHLKKMEREGSSSIPPLRKKKQGELESQASDQLSMAFRRYAIEGEDDQDAAEERYGI